MSVPLVGLIYSKLLKMGRSFLSQMRSLLSCKKMTLRSFSHVGYMTESAPLPGKSCCWRWVGQPASQAARQLGGRLGLTRKDEGRQIYSSGHPHPPPLPPSLRTASVAKKFKLCLKRNVILPKLLGKLLSDQLQCWICWDHSEHHSLQMVSATVFIWLFFSILHCNDLCLCLIPLKDQ